VSLGRTYRKHDPAEAVALVAASRRMLLLRVHRRRLRWEDLEDAYSQATLELVARARRSPFQSNAHIANALEQKFLSRIDDRRRAIGGRSAMEAALAGALPIDEPETGAGEIEDRGAEVLHKVARRLDLQRVREVVADLTDDQRLVLGCQVTHGMDCAEFCARYGWSAEKYRKVAQRARARLRVLVDSHQSGERCRLLEPDIVAHAAGALEPARSERVLRHLENCRPCARHVHELERASRHVAALLPAPVALPLVAKAGTLAKLAAVVAGARRVVPFADRGAHAGTVTAGAGGGAVGAGGSLVGAGFAKLGVAAACVAGAAGGLALCSHAGLIGGGAAKHGGHVAAAVRPTARDIGPTGGRGFGPTRTLALSREIGGASPQRGRRFGSGRPAQSQAILEFGPLVRGIARAARAPRGVVARPAPPRSDGAAGARRRNELGFER
jgi:DNA-directed RNA polymerase specialized sigma24 family protein